MGLGKPAVEVLRRRDTTEDLLDEVAGYAEMSPSGRDREMQELARLAAAILRDRADADAVLAWQDPVPESTNRLWRALMARRTYGPDRL
jgi:hypothetical protein